MAYRDPNSTTFSASRNSGDGDRYVQTDAIIKAVVGHEAEVLKAVGIDWPGGSKHITCPYPDHGGAADWRWDNKARRAFCSCAGRRGEPGVHSIFDVVVVKEGCNFAAAKIRIAEAIGRSDLIQIPSKPQAMDAASLLSVPVEKRDDHLPIAYLAHRLGVSEAEVPRPNTRVVGIKALNYFDAPTGTGDKPGLVGEFPCAVFETVDVDDRRHAHRIYLAPGGAGKADLGKRADGEERDPKKSANKVDKSDRVTGRGVIWGDPAQAPHLIVAEGIETAAAVALVWWAEIEAGTVAVVSAIDANGVEAIRPWPATKIITVAADRDEGINDDGRQRGRRGEQAARKLAMARQDQVEVRIALPGEPGTKTDWLDVLRANGAAAVRAGVNHAEPFARADHGEDKDWDKRDTAGQDDLFNLLDIRAMRALPEPKWLIEDLIPATAATILFGPSNSYKSFLAVDLGLHIAAGRDYNGRKVRQGSVIYIATEGGAGVGSKRVQGWLAHHGVGDEIPFFLLPQELLLTNSDVLEKLCRTIDARLGGNLALVICDVLRGTMEGSEGDDEAVAARVQVTQQLVRRYGATEITITHTGWSDATRARGHTHLWGSYDTRLLVEGDKDDRTTTLTVERHKDDESGEAMYFALQVVPVPGLEKRERETGDMVPVTTLVPEYQPGMKPDKRDTAGQRSMSAAAKIALDQLRNAVIDGGTPPPAHMKDIPRSVLVVSKDLWRSRCYSAGISDSTDSAKRKAFARAVDTLKQRGLVAEWENMAWLVKEGPDEWASGTRRDTTGHVQHCPHVPERDRTGHVSLDMSRYVPQTDTERGGEEGKSLPAEDQAAAEETDLRTAVDDEEKKPNDLPAGSNDPETPRPLPKDIDIVEYDA